MTIAGRIEQYVEQMPVSLQTEVLHFVEYLTEKSGREDAAWSDMSLAAAMRGMEDEDGPAYTATDLKAVFR
jgi:hypothetical protein